MSSGRWLSLALLVYGAACGRVGVGLLPLDAASTPPHLERDAGEAGLGFDAFVPSDGGLLENDVLVDAGAPRDAGLDAGRDAGQDAGADGGTDAGLDATVDAALPPDCAGEIVFGVCWYLAQANTSCNDSCAAHGGYDSRTASYVGTSQQGGSIEECTAIMTALGRTDTVGPARRSDDYGFGCHVWVDGNDNYWLVDPPFRPSVAAPSGTAVRLVCGCMR